MTDIINWVMSHTGQLISILTGVVTVASAVAALTPTPKDDGIVGKAYKVVDWLALNVGQAKNKPGE